jgi:cytochrome bd-type quinol oxidase subunit 2
MKTFTTLYFFSLVVLILAAYIIAYTTVFNMLYTAGILSLVGLILNMLAFLGIRSIKKCEPDC